MADRLRAAGCRVDIVDADDQLGKRIRTAKLEKIPYVLVVGDDDVAAQHGRRQPAAVTRSSAASRSTSSSAGFTDELAAATHAALGA